VCKFVDSSIFFKFALFYVFETLFEKVYLAKLVYHPSTYKNANQHLQDHKQWKVEELGSSKFDALHGSLNCTKKSCDCEPVVALSTCQGICFTALA
jgi:hypothetical protein